MDADNIRDSVIYGDPASKTMAAAATGGGLGAIAGAVTHGWKEVPGKVATPAKDAIRAIGGNGLYFGLVGATFAGTEYVAEQMRGTKDILNGAIAGCAAGSLAGFRAGSLPATFGGCIAAASLVTIYDMTRSTEKPEEMIQASLRKLKGEQQENLEQLQG